MCVRALELKLKRRRRRRMERRKVGFAIHSPSGKEGKGREGGIFCGYKDGKLFLADAETLEGIGGEQKGEGKERGNTA